MRAIRQEDVQRGNVIRGGVGRIGDENAALAQRFGTRPLDRAAEAGHLLAVVGVGCFEAKFAEAGLM